MDFAAQWDEYSAHWPKVGDRVGSRRVLRVFGNGDVIFGEDIPDKGNCGAYWTSKEEWNDYKSVPARIIGTVKAKLVHLGRAKPLPLTDND